MGELDLAGMLPAVTLNVFPPATAVVTRPVHEPPTVSGVAFTRFAGYVSVKAIPESAEGPGLVTVKVSVLVPLGAIVAGANAFAMVGLPSTLSVAVFEAGPCGSAAVVTPLVVLFCLPPVALVTTSVMVQPAAGMLRPAKLSAVCPATSAVT